MITISRLKISQGQKLQESREKGEWKGLTLGKKKCLIHHEQQFPKEQVK